MLARCTAGHPHPVASALHCACRHRKFSLYDAEALALIWKHKMGGETAEETTVKKSRRGHATGNCRAALVNHSQLTSLQTMRKIFKTGDHVSWNSEAGRVSGTIMKVHTKNVNVKGYIHHATRDDPQYEIRSGRTDHIALHKGSALRHVRG
jgi:hypothetical protein